MAMGSPAEGTAGLPSRLEQHWEWGDPSCWRLGVRASTAAPSVRRQPCGNLSWQRAARHWWQRRSHALGAAIVRAAHDIGKGSRRCSYLGRASFRPRKSMNVCQRKAQIVADASK
jgi:hypothetical protein